MNNLEKLNSIYAELVAIEAELYQTYKNSDESTSVHITMVQQDISSAVTVLEDLLGKE